MNSVQYIYCPKRTYHKIMTKYFMIFIINNAHPNAQNKLFIISCWLLTTLTLTTDIARWAPNSCKLG